MSYLKLDKTNISYYEKIANPYNLILSQIIDSSCSPVTPKMIYTEEELDIYFGRSFKEREYYRELLSKGASLLLYKPIHKGTYGEPVLDLSEYTYHTEKFNSPEDLPDPTPQGNYIFKVGPDEEEYVWYLSRYVPVRLLPTEEKPSSFLNRNTLRLCDRGFSETYKFSWCHPKYTSIDYTPSYTERIEDEEIPSLLQSIKSHGLDDENRGIVFDLDFTDVEDFGGSNYIVFPLSSDFEYPRVQFYFSSYPPLGADVINGGYSEKIQPGNKFEVTNNILNALRNKYGYKITKTGNYSYKIRTTDTLKDQNFFKLPGLIYKKDFIGTQNILSLLSKDHNRLEIYSKTFGPGDEPIYVTVEKVKGKQEYYRFSFSCYTYTETFEGPLYLEEDEETQTFISLEKLINQGSKLVEIKVYNQGRNKDNPLDGISEGSYILARAEKESTSKPEDYHRALDILKDYNISEDFLLVPDIYKFTIQGASKNENWIKEYETLLDYANQKNCQVLITNFSYKFGCDSLVFVNELPGDPKTNVMYGLEVDTDTILYETWDGKTWTIYNSDPLHQNRVTEIQETFKPEYNGNQIFNYTKDQDNRLVYFYQDMSLYGYYRPSYYMFLDSLQTGIYTKTTDQILYKSPVQPYQEDTTDLGRWKSNFLSCNEHIFYYRELFGHTGDWKYNTTILSRFCMSKVSNTISREFPFYLGLQTTGEIIRGLNSILSSLLRQYPIIGYLSLNQIEEDIDNQKISVTIDLGIREKLDKDVNLSVTINFNNN